VLKKYLAVKNYHPSFDVIAHIRGWLKARCSHISTRTRFTIFLRTDMEFIVMEVNYLLDQCGKVFSDFIFYHKGGEEEIRTSVFHAL
jgi:hypothetical protein